MRAAARVVEHLKVLGEASGNGRRFCGAHLRSEPDMVRHLGKFANGTRLTIFIEANCGSRDETMRIGDPLRLGPQRILIVSALASTHWHHMTIVTLRSLKKKRDGSPDGCCCGWSYSPNAVLEK